jgi:phosphoglycolate phosphatase
MKYKGVIFDLDGTLLDTLEDITDSMNQVLEGRGFPTHPEEAYLRFVGNGADMLVSRALPNEHKNDEMLVEECLNEFRKIYETNWNNMTMPYDGIPELLDTLKRENIKIAVLSNKPQQFTDLCVNELLADWEFDYVLGHREGTPLKPDPKGAVEITEKLGISAEDFILLGDSDIDMKTAINAGMFPLGALWGFRTEQELLDSGALKVILHPLELLDLE